MRSLSLLLAGTAAAVLAGCASASTSESEATSRTIVPPTAATGSSVPAASIVPVAPVATTAPVFAPVDMKPYPPAMAGQKQNVIRLPVMADETALKVELIPGRTMRIDCNNHFFAGQLAERTVTGWGYNYYVLDSLGQGASTRMACPPGSERVVFVSTSQQTLLPYDSRLPIVVYTPTDTELRYRIWRAAAQIPVN